MKITRRTRAAKTEPQPEPEKVKTATNTMSEPQAQEEPTFDEVFLYRSSSSEQDSDSDYVRPKRKGRKQPKAKGKKSRGRQRKPGRTPSVPPMSDDELYRSRGSPELGDYLEIDARPPLPTIKSAYKVAQERKLQEEIDHPLPATIKIQVNAMNGGTPTVINLNLADLLKRRGTTTRKSLSPSNDTVVQASQVVENDETLIAEAPQYRSKRAKMRHEAKSKIESTKLDKTGFTHLPYEIRIRIYRQVFVSGDPLIFASREDFERSSQFLRTCSLVYEEGREVLYGENSFHFERSSAQRGSFYEKEWREIGFKDVRRFLESIGSMNLSMIKYVSLGLSDAQPSATTYLDEEERRCVNDPVLHYVLHLIGAHTTLSKLAMSFSIRRQLSTTDYHFLKALASISCYELIHAHPPHYWRTPTRAPFCVLTKLKQLMLVKEVDDDVDLSKKKMTPVKLYQETRTNSYELDRYSI